MRAFVSALRRSPLLLVGTVIVCLLVAVAVLAPWIAPYDPQAITGSSFESPSSAHLLGTNDAGSDIFSRLVMGSRTTLVVAGAATALILVIGLALGLTAGLRGGFVDVAIMRLVDVFLALPGLPLLIFIAALAGPSLTLSILMIGLFGWPQTARIVRSQSLSLRNRGYVDSARGFGGGALYVMRRHLLPALGPVIAANLVFVAGTAVTIEAGLAFIGLSDPAAVSWGAELNRAVGNPQIYFGTLWLYWLLPAGLALTLVVLGFTFIGVGLEPRFNPRWDRAGAVSRPPAVPISPRQDERTRMTDMTKVTIPTDPTDMTTVMGRRTFLQGMAGVAGAVLLGGCSGNARPGAGGGRPTVRVVSWTSLGYPSPFTYTAGPGYWRMSLLFDTLLWPDSTGEQLPWLASSYKRSEDGLTYTLDLRDVTWDDGRPLTARDVAFTYEYYTTQTFTPLLVGVPPKVATVTPTGERSVEFRLEKPDATFLQQVLGTMPVVPEHVWSKITDPMATFDKRALISTGAYTLKSRDEAQDSEAYVAKDNYFLGPPFVRRIEMLPAGNPLTALKVGQLDGAASAAEGVTNTLLEPFRDDPQYGMISSKSGFAFPLFFNISRGGALADLRFRRACLHAIDRVDIVKRLLTGNGQVGSQGWLPPSHPYYNPEVRDYPFDRAEAERLLDEAGYRRSGSGGARTNPDGSPLRYKLHIPNVVPIALAELTAASLKAVGVEIDLQRIDLVRLFGTKLQESFDLLITSYPGPSGVGPGGDPDLLRGVYYSKPPNPFHKATGYANPEVDRLLDAQLATYDVEERKRLVGQIQKLVADDLPVAMLYYTTFFYAYRKKVFDQWYYTPGGMGPGIPEVYNKQAYITGNKKGLEVRRATKA